jgi:3-phosphoshikimate 1-carboxyvinyltransferase
MTADYVSARVLVQPKPGGVPSDLGAPVLPGSKSHAQRALLVAGLGVGTSTLDNMPDSGDVQVLGAALAALGARVERDGARWKVHAAAELRDARIQCHDNGTALRMLMMMVGMLGGRATFDGSPRLRQRPVDEAVTALRAHGVRVNDRWPVRVDGQAPRTDSPAEMVLTARTTSQVVSGAMLGLACAAARGVAGPRAVRVEGPITAAALYWSITTQVLDAFGARWRSEASADGVRMMVDQVRPREHCYGVPVDASAATFVSALAALHGADLPRWPDQDGHPDWLVNAELLCLRSAEPNATWSAQLLASLPDTFPALCAVSAQRAAPSVLRGAPVLRHKESDRVAAMAAGLRPLGVSCTEHDDGLVLVGRDLRRRAASAPIPLPAPADHRVVMALALLGTLVPAGVVVDHAPCVAKSWPGYFDWLARVADVERTR